MNPPSIKIRSKVEGMERALKIKNKMLHDAHSSRREVLDESVKLKRRIIELEKIVDALQHELRVWRGEAE